METFSSVTCKRSGRVILVVNVLLVKGKMKRRMIPKLANLLGQNADNQKKSIYDRKES
jgi:hypothetical protein